MRLLGWILVWIVVLLLSVAYLWPKVRRLLRRAGGLGTELGLAQDRLAEVAASLHLLDARIDSPDQLAVFGSPATIRSERERTRRTLGKQRLARRRRTRPRWAQRVDSERH